MSRRAEPGACLGRHSSDFRGRGIRGWVKQERGELDRGDAVDHAVMGLPDDPDAAVLEPVGDADLPEGAIAPQLRRHA